MSERIDTGDILEDVADLSLQSTLLSVKAKTDLIINGIAEQETLLLIKNKTDLITAGIAEQSTLLTVKGKTDLINFLVASIDSGSNVTINDILGNKLDTRTGTSIIALLRAAHYESEIVDTHVHRRARTFGISANQTGTNWCTEDRLVPFRAISGNNAYGGDANDEAKVFGTTDTPFIVGQTLFDPGMLQVIAASNDTTYIIRFVWGTGTLADAIIAGQYSTTPNRFDSANPQETAFVRIDVGTDRIAIGTKVWVQIKNATDNAWLDFYVNAHGYEE
ncbi:MAG: hypothetical protein ACM31H_03830 [Nitrososphaerales archaeon]